MPGRLANYSVKERSDAFFYLDPPVGANQGHYNGCSQADFDALLKLLETIQGKFLMISYRNKTLQTFRRGTAGALSKSE